MALAYTIGLGGLLIAPDTGTLVWVGAFGLAQGSGFALALTLIVLRSPTPLVAARLGGVAQCLGYLLAALGPLVIGALHDLTGGWTWPVVLLLAALVPMTWAGWGAARNAVLRTTSAQRHRKALEPAQRLQVPPHRPAAHPEIAGTARSAPAARRRPPAGPGRRRRSSGCPRRRPRGRGRWPG